MMLEDVLDELVPPRSAPDRWREIAASARRRRLPFFLAPIALAAVVALGVLAWPFGGSQGSILDRAAAAIGDGPVVHAVVQSGFGGTQVDLATGARAVIHEQEELWYDPQRGVRVLTTFAGVVQGDAVYPPGRVAYIDKTLAFLATDYRTALKNGSAKLLGDGDVNGTPVYWIRVDTQMLPDVADGRDHEWAHDVAVDQRTLKPVATRETRDGVLSPDGISRVESVESLASASFTSTHSMPTWGRYSIDGSLTKDEAASVLGAPLLTAGDALDGLPLSRIGKETRVEPGSTHYGVMLYYGPSSGGGIGVPPPAGDYVQVSETTQPDDQFQRGVVGYAPPEGTVLVFGGGIGVMQKAGVHIALEASSEQLLLDAAKALN